MRLANRAREPASSGVRHRHLHRRSATLFAALASVLVAAAATVRWPHVLARLAGELLPFDVTWHVKTAEPMVALSFDDGPSPATTPDLLEILARHHARATFFLIGSRVAGNEAIVTDLVGRGNEIANHSMFDRPSVRLSPREFKTDFLHAHRILSAYAQIHLFRPASGWFTCTMLKIIAAYDYRCVLGSVAVLDANHRQPRSQARRMLRRIGPGAIIILHEGTPQRRGVIELTEILVSGLRLLGYQVCTVSELVSADADRPVNAGSRRPACRCHTAADAGAPRRRAGPRQPKGTGARVSR